MEVALSYMFIALSWHAQWTHTVTIRGVVFRLSALVMAGRQDGGKEVGVCLVVFACLRDL
jgi:hypothetical protein